MIILYWSSHHFPASAAWVPSFKHLNPSGTRHIAITAERECHKASRVWDVLFSGSPICHQCFNIILECDHGNFFAWTSCYVKQPASELMVSEVLGVHVQLCKPIMVSHWILVTSSSLSPPFASSRMATENSWIVNLQRSLWDHFRNYDLELDFIHASKQVHKVEWKHETHPVSTPGLHTHMHMHPHTCSRCLSLKFRAHQFSKYH